MASNSSSKVKVTPPVKRRAWPWVLGLTIAILFFVFFALVILGVVVQNIRGNSSNITGTMMGSYGQDENYSLATAAGEFKQIETTTGTTTTIDQKVIKTGDLSVVVNSTSSAVTLITTLAQEHAGYVTSSETHTDSNENLAGSITLRVPADQFESVLALIKSKAVLVEAEQVTGTDVTEEFIDLEARLSNAKALETSLVTILAQATSVEDTLKVTKALSQAREDIESLQGQIDYIQARTDFSTITVDLTERPSLISSGSATFDVLLVFEQAFQALSLLARTILILLIWVVVIGGPIFVFFWLVWKLAGKMRHGKRST